MKNINYKTIIKIIISTFLVVFLLSKLDIEKLSLLNTTSLIYICGGILITLFSLLLMTMRWYTLCSLIRKDINLKKLYFYYLTGAFYNIFLPGAIGGDVIRTRKLMTNYKISLKKSTSITVAERVCGLYTLFMLCVFGLLFFDIPNELIPDIDNKYLFILFFILIALILIVKKLIERKIKIKYNQVIIIIILSFIAQLGDVLIAYTFNINLGLDLTFTQFLVIMPIVYFATVLPISLGGLGVREGTFVAILSLYNIETSVAVLISFMMFLVKVITGLIGWLIVVLDKKNG